MDETEAPEVPKILTGFAVFIDKHGEVYVERNPQVFNLEMERAATLLEVRRYASEIVMDLQAQAAAEYVNMAGRKQES